MLKQLSVALTMALLCGCFKVKDELTIESDGSGTVRIETRTRLPSGMLGGAAMFGIDSGPIYPPLSEADARKFFPGTDFTVTTRNETSDQGESTTVIEVAFEDINSLLASPYGRAHQLSLRIEDGDLILKAMNGLEGGARLAEIKDEGEMGGFAELADPKLKDEMRSEFRITLPNEIASANGDRQGRSVTWIVDRTEIKDPEEFASKSATVLEARCPASGVTMTPSAPLRMGLSSFAELVAGAAAGPASGFDTNRIAAAAKFIPYALHVTRSVDLSGDDSMSDSSAQLVGAIVVPIELAPQKWGEAKVSEVVDARGKSLKLDDDEGSRWSRYSFSNLEEDEGEDEESDEDEDEERKAKGVVKTEKRRTVTLTFQPPDWEVNQIARIKGSVGLRYFSGSQLVKLTNAIPARWIMDQKSMLSAGSFDSSSKALSDPMLDEIGLSISLEMGMAQSGWTMLTFELEGGTAALLDAQVFDADGKPWPTFMQDMSAGFPAGPTSTASVIVAGKPRPPLSLGLVASGTGATVEIPITLENVPVIVTSK